MEAIACLPGAQTHTQETHGHKTRSHGHISRDTSREHSHVRPVAFVLGTRDPETKIPPPPHTGCDISATQKHRKSWSLSSGVNVDKLHEAAGNSEEYDGGLTRILLDLAGH